MLGLQPFKLWMIIEKKNNLTLRGLITTTADNILIFLCIFRENKACHFVGKASRNGFFK